VGARECRVSKSIDLPADYGYIKKRKRRDGAHFSKWRLEEINHQVKELADGDGLSVNYCVEVKRPPCPKGGERDGWWQQVALSRRLQPLQNPSFL
jgi:hypothetical protein